MTPSLDVSAPRAVRCGPALAALYAALLLCAYAVAWSGRTPNTDLILALGGGKDVAEGKLGKPDDWSYLTEGRVCINQSWLSGWALYEVWRVSGETGLLLTRSALLAVIGLGVIAWLRGRGRTWPAMAIAAAAALMVGRGYFMLRGNLFTLALAPWLLYLLDRQASGSRHWAWPIGLLLAVWTHCHGGYLYGFAITALWLGIHFLATLRGVGAWSWPRWLELGAAWLIAAVLIVFGPFGVEHLQRTLMWTGGTEWRQLVEWWPLVRSGEYVNELRNNFIAVGYFSVMLAVTAIAVLRAGTDLLRAYRFPAPLTQQFLERDGAAAAAESNPSPSDAAPPAAMVARVTSGSPTALDWPRLLFDVVLVAVTVYMAFKGRRFTALAGVVLALPLATAFDAFICPPAGASSGGRSDDARFSTPPRRARLAVVGGVMLALTGSAAFMMLYFGYGRGHPFYPNESLFDRQLGVSQLPVAATRFMRVAGMTGPTFHQHDMEDYLHWTVPGILVGCGGRAHQVYTDDDLRQRRQIDDVTALDAAAMARRQAFFERYGIRTMLLSTDTRWPLILALIERTEWAPVFFDGDFCLLVRPDESSRRWLDALAADAGEVVKPSDDPDESRASAVALRGRPVYPSEAVYRRTRALLLSTGRVRPGGASSGVLTAAGFDVCRAEIERAQSLDPHPLLYGLLDRLARRTNSAGRELCEYDEREMQRLEKLPADGPMYANILLCRRAAALRAAKLHRDSGEAADAQRLEQTAADIADKLNELSFWWQM